MTQTPSPLPYYAPVSNGQAVGSMVVGIIAAAVGVWSVVPFLGLFAAFLAAVPAVVAVVLGHGGLTRSRTLGGYGRGQALTGLITGYGTIAVIGLTLVVWVLTFIASAFSR